MDAWLRLPVSGTTMDDWEDLDGEDDTADAASRMTQAESPANLLSTTSPVSSNSNEQGQADVDGALSDDVSLGTPDNVDLDARAPKSEPEQEEPLCRICFSGDDEPELGRLISPCLCRGTVAKVHVACLNRWRTHSRASTSFFQCDQCRYRYRIKRAKIAGLAENRAALGVLTIGFFLVLVIINGFIGNWLLQQGSSDSFVGSVFFSPAPDPYTSWPYRESYLPLEAVGQAVEFASKVAEDLTSSSSQSGNEKDKGIISFLHSKGYDPEASETSYRMARPKAGRTRGSRRRRVKKQVSRFLNHFVLGISMTGIGSFLWLILTLPLWPLHPLRNGLFRSMRSTRDSRGGPSPLGSALLVLFVLVGLIKSLHLCWKLTRKTAHVILAKAENGILEVHA